MTGLRRTWSRMAIPLLLTAVAVITACSEKLLTPVNCPELCPGGQIVVYDTVLTPIAGSDSTYTGYVAANQAAAFLVSNNLPAATAVGFVRFIQRNDSIFVLDTARAYTIDSVTISLTVASRDTMQAGIALLLYKLPPTIDSTSTYAEVTAAFTPESFLDTLEIPDTLVTGEVTASFTGELLNRVALAPADSGVLRLGVALIAAAPTGMRINTIRAGTGAPSFRTYVQADVADTTLQDQFITRPPSYNSYLLESPFPQPTLTTLLIGGAPSSRSMLRFVFPPVLKDTAELIRATLELTPVSPIIGVSNISSSILVQGILVDLGAKSPLIGDAARELPFTVPTSAVQSIEVLPLVKLWQGTAGRPSNLMIQLAPEGSSFSVPIFGSSATPATQPRLRIEFVRPYQFALP